MDVEKCHDAIAVEDLTRAELAGDDLTKDAWIHDHHSGERAESRRMNRWSVTNMSSNTRRLIVQIDRIDRASYTGGRWRWAHKGGARGRRRCGWRPKTYRAVPHIPSTAV